MKKIGISYAIIGLMAFGGFYSPAFAQPIVAEENSKEFASRTLAKIDSLETQMRDLTNIIERLEKEIAAQKAENQRLVKIIDENSSRLSKLENNKPVIEQEPTQPDEKKIEPAPAPTPVPAPIVEKPEIKPEIKESQPLNPPIITPTPTPLPVIQAQSAADLLASAKLAIQNSEYDIAKSKLKSLIDNHGESNEGIEALWLNGELVFMSKDWLGAAQNYVAYLKVAPTGPRVSDVLIRLASSYREMGDNRQRCLALNAYSERTPNPNAIQKSRANDEFAKGACPKTNAK